MLGSFQLHGSAFARKMSLKFKIGLGVLTATLVLAAIMSWLWLAASDRLDQAAKTQNLRASQSFDAYVKQSQGRFDEYARGATRAFEDYAEEQHRRGLEDARALALERVDRFTGYTVSELAEALRDPGNGIEETAILSRHPETGALESRILKPEGSRATLGPDEEIVADRVFSSGKHEFLGDVLFVPYWSGETAGSPNYVLRLRVPMRSPARIELPPPVSLPPPEPLPESETPDLGAVAAVGFMALILAMGAVFAVLTMALRRFVLSPLGSVLEDSRKIVTGEGGFEVRGAKGTDDIGTLVAAFNAMFAELKAYQADLEGKVRDATRTIERQQHSLVVAQRLAATGTLAAGLAHEVNNPLSGMINALRRLKMREGLDERGLEYVGLIEEGLQRIEKLMKQILDFSRRREVKPERFDPLQSLRRVLPLIRHRLDKRNITLEENIQPELPLVFGNEEEIGQVLMNLLINAADASTEGGSVRVGIAATPGGGALLTVEDQGPGVPDEILGRIFDPFFTTKEPGQGTGLGLSIVHTIVDNHGGKLRVERSEKLGGAKFVVELPPAEKGESTRRLIPPDLRRE